MEGPRGHPDWYDLQDTAWTASSEREPEHYREFVLSLPPLGSQDHLVDVGAGKLARMEAQAYPDLGRVALMEPVETKLARAQKGLVEALPQAENHDLASGPGGGASLPQAQGSPLSIGAS